MASMLSIKSLTLDLPPSCVAFCPSQPQFFVVGTYHLHRAETTNEVAIERPNISEGTNSNLSLGSAHSQQSQTRTGSLILFQYQSGIIRQLETAETDFGVLDVRWTAHSQLLGDLLAVATSIGSVALYRLQYDNESSCLTLLSQNVVADPSILVLSVRWHPFHPHILGVTLSDGNVSLVESIEGNPRDNNAVVKIHNIHQHELEAWTSTFVGKDPVCVLSGGDDIVLQSSRITDDLDRSFLWGDRRLHQAGVTSILPLTPELVLTGSYDDHIRLISCPPNARARTQAELNLGGGVWQLRLLRQPCLPIVVEAKQKHMDESGSERVLILASCMHAGSRIVRLCKGCGSGWAFDIMAKFEEHQSMNYGTDVQPSNSSLKSIVSTSFYDKLLCLWQFELDSRESGR